MTQAATEAMQPEPEREPPRQLGANLAVSARGLALGYGSKTVLGPVDLDIPTGTTTALIGPNGAGKSTLLHGLAGLLRSQRGSLEVPARTTTAGVALVLQATDDNSRLPLTVREVVAMGRYPHHRFSGRLHSHDRTAIHDAIDQLELRDLMSAQVRELSGGQRQRALVAQGLAQDADLLVLDEPFTGLDLVSRASIADCLERLRAEGRTVVLSTHDLSDAAMADLAVLLAGRVVAAGPPEKVLTDNHLSAAYGGRLLRLGGQVALLDDPHAHEQ